MRKLKTVEERRKFIEKNADVFIALGAPTEMDANGKSVLSQAFIEEKSAMPAEDENAELLDADTSKLLNQMVNPIPKSEVYGRMIRGLLKSDGSEESKRWNHLLGIYSQTKQGQAKLIRYAAMKLITSDFSQLMDVVSGKIAPTRENMDSMLLGFIGANHIGMVKGLDSDVINDKEKEVLVNVLQSRLFLFEHLNLVNVWTSLSKGYFAEIMPDFADRLRNPDIFQKVLAFGGMHMSQKDPLSAEFSTMFRLLTVGNGELQKKGLATLVKSDDEDIILLKPEGRNYILSDPNQKDVTDKKNMLDLVEKVGAHPENADSIVKVDKLSENQQELLEKFIKDEQNSIPEITDEQYQARKDFYAEMDFASDYLSSLRLGIRKELREKDTTLADLYAYMDNFRENEISPDRIAAAALSVISSNHHCAGNSDKKEKVKIALTALKLVKPELEKNIEETLNKSLPAKEKITVDIQKDGQVYNPKGAFEEKDFDYSKEIKNSDTFTQLREMHDYLFSGKADPWYHKNGKEFKDLRNAVDTAICMSKQKPMSKDCVDEMLKRILDKAEAYVNTHKDNPRTSLGDRRLRAAFVCAHIAKPNMFSLGSSVNEHRSKEKKIDVQNEIKKLGLTANPTKDNTLSKMITSIRDSGENYVKAKSENHEEDMTKYASSIVAKTCLKELIASNKIDLSDYHYLESRKICDKLTSAIYHNPDFEKFTGELTLSDLKDLTISKSEKCKNNMEALDLAKREFVLIAEDILPESVSTALAHEVAGTTPSAEQPAAKNNAGMKL